MTRTTVDPAHILAADGEAECWDPTTLADQMRAAAQLARWLDGRELGPLGALSMRRDYSGRIQLNAIAHGGCPAVVAWAQAAGAPVAVRTHSEAAAVVEVIVDLGADVWLTVWDTASLSTPLGELLRERLADARDRQADQRDLVTAGAS